MVFESFGGKFINDSPLAIFEEFKRREGYELIWLVSPGNNTCVDGATTIKLRSVKELYHLATARVWVDNFRKQIWLSKRKGQYYVQTWHARFFIKKAEEGAEDRLPEYYVEKAKHDSKMIDIIPINSDFGEFFYKRHFWYDNAVIRTGVPASDFLYKESYSAVKKRVCDYFNEKPEVRFVLYAPTFRNDNLYDYGLNYKRIVDSMEARLGGKWKIIERLHPNCESRGVSNREDACVLDGSRYSDIDDLIMASSFFISDYSSCIFDAVEAGIPTVLYAKDYNAYVQERGVYFTFEELPFPYAFEEEQLVETLMNFDQAKYTQEVGNFVMRHNIIMQDGSSKRLVDYILGII